MQIEGVVTGEPDDGVVQSEGGQIPIDDDDDEETDENDDVMVEYWILFYFFQFLVINVIWCFSISFYEALWIKPNSFAVNLKLFFPLGIEN